MKILSIETTSKICSVSILENTKLLKQISLNNGLTHSETLMPIIKDLFDFLNLQLKNIDLIVCDKGPGSFTGIRIGIATAKGFHDSLNIDTIGISSLEGLAYNCKNDGIICSLINAKNSNCYYGIFEKKGNKYFKKAEFSIDSIDNILKNLQNFNKPICFVGDGSVIYKNEILQNLTNCEFEENNDLSSYNLGLAGLEHYNNKSQELLPMYLRLSQAERLLKSKNIS